VHQHVQQHHQLGRVQFQLVLLLQQQVGHCLESGTSSVTPFGENRTVLRRLVNEFRIHGFRLRQNERYGFRLRQNERYAEISVYSLGAILSQILLQPLILRPIVRVMFTIDPGDGGFLTELAGAGNRGCSFDFWGIVPT
jgi:hypothetical protein